MKVRMCASSSAISAVISLLIDKASVECNSESGAAIGAVFHGNFPSVTEDDALADEQPDPAGGFPGGGQVGGASELFEEGVEFVFGYPRALVFDA